MSEIRELLDGALQDKLAGHILQSYAWGEFKKSTSAGTKVIRLAEERDGQIAHIYQLFFHRIPKTPLTIGYLPRSKVPTSRVLEEIKEVCRQGKAIFLKIDPDIGEKGQVKESKPGKAIQPEHTIYLDLQGSEDKLLENMHPKTRYNIGLAERKGVTVKMENTTTGLATFMDILEETEKRQNFYAHNRRYYQKLWETMESKKMIYILNAYAEGKAVASILLFRFRDFLYYPYGGSVYEYRPLMAPHLLHWEAIRLGKKLGCKTYDLWGSYEKTPTETDPWWGFYRFKSGFGGKEIDFPQTIDIPLSPLYTLYTMAEDLRWKYLKLKNSFR